MSQAGKIYSGSCGNRVADFCDRYLHFGQNKNTIYCQEGQSKIIIGKDRCEPRAVTLLRISSWATLFFPLIVIITKACIKPQTSRTDLKKWSPEYLDEIGNLGGRQREISAHFYEGLTTSKIRRVAYDHIYTCLVRGDKSQCLFDGDSPYHGSKTGPGAIAVYIPKDGDVSIDILEEQAKKYDIVTCVLSPNDAEKALHEGRRENYSNAFKQVLTEGL